MVATEMPVATTARVLTGVLVVQTYYVHPMGQTPHFEVHVASDRDAKQVVLVTRDLAIYHRALEAEGRDQRYDIHWKASRTAAGKHCQVIDRFTEAAPSPQKGLPL